MTSPSEAEARLDRSCHVVGVRARQPTHQDGGDAGVTGAAVCQVSSGLATRTHRVGGNASLVGTREGLAGALPLRPPLPLTALPLTSLPLTSLPLTALALHPLALAGLALRSLTLAGLTLWPLALSLAALTLRGALVGPLAFALRALALLALSLGSLTLTFALPLATAGAALRLIRTTAALPTAIGATLAAVSGSAESGAARSTLEAGTARSAVVAGADAAQGAARIREERMETMPTLPPQQLNATFTAELRTGEHATHDAAHHRTGRSLAGVAILGEALARRGKKSRHGGGRNQKSLHARYPQDPRRDVMS